MGFSRNVGRVRVGADEKVSQTGNRTIGKDDPGSGDQVEGIGIHKSPCPSRGGFFMLVSPALCECCYRQLRAGWVVYFWVAFGHSVANSLASSFTSRPAALRISAQTGRRSKALIVTPSAAICGPTVASSSFNSASV